MYRILFTGLLAATCLVSVQAARAQENEEPLAGYDNNSPIVLTGTVAEVHEDEFTLRYGDGNVNVELDDWATEGENLAFLKPGDRVTVSGRIDDDFFNGREIEASNIYLDNAYVYYYEDSGEYPAYYMSDRTTEMKDGVFVSMRGTVEKIDGREFTVRGPDGAMQVDTSQLDYDPFDDEGLQHVRIGDKVHVYGDIDDGFFEEREIMADGIVTLSQRDTNPAGSVN